MGSDILRHTLWLDGTLVSTCFVEAEMTHSWPDKKPWETMIRCLDIDDDIFWNAQSPEEAMWQHALCVARVATIKKEPPSASEPRCLGAELSKQHQLPQ